MDGLSIHNLIGMKTNTWMVISLIFLIWAVGATMGTVNYYQISQNQQTTIANLQSVVNNVAVKVNIGINYGNGTTAWYNDTYISNGWSLFNATMSITTVNYTVDPVLGIWVKGINGVFENATAAQYWLWYTWSSGNWTLGPVGADAYLLKNGETIKWELTTF
jgi:hypothetical protein